MEADRIERAKYDALSEEEQADFDYLEALGEPSLDGSFLPKLLMMIVKGNPLGKSTETTSDVKRVERALKALLGRDGFKSTRRHATERALRLMAQGYLEDRGGEQIGVGPNRFGWLERNPKGARSIEELARYASGREAGSPSARSLQNETSREDMVRRALSEIHASDIPGSLQQHSLSAIAVTLRAHGVIKPEG